MWQPLLREKSLLWIVFTSHSHCHEEQARAGVFLGQGFFQTERQEQVRLGETFLRKPSELTRRTHDAGPG